MSRERSRMKIVRSAVLATAAVAVVMMPTATHADVRGHADPAGDVRSVALDADHKPVTSPSTAEPAVTLGDITNVRVVHNSRRVTVVMRFRDLRKAGTGHLHEVLFASPKRS